MDAKLDAQAAQIIRQHVLRVARMPLIQIERNDFELHRRMLAQAQQDVE